ncbi:MAG: alpha/beta hydrolase [Piscirickettsiaceae bacterium]|nr:MAG: alpha/beta hydrolase [Piscirickettsiaceae bacterium]PCI71203.1 MAG: alpha/beta hydrolase [Piscirickettsiaceae bacterium]
MAVTHSETQWVACDGTAMHAVRWLPDGEIKMVICLIHGLGEHSGRYQEMAEYYASFGVEVVSFDLRGHGKSDGQRGHCHDFQQLIRDIDRFLNQASKIDLDKPHFIYGHSLGATLALKYTLAHPGEYKGVILSAPLLKPAFEPPKWKVMLGKKLQSLWPTLSLSNEVDINTLSRDKEVLRKNKEDPLTHDRISAKLGTQMLEAGEQLLKDASQVDFPMLMMHGDADELTCHKASALFSECAGELCTLKIWEDFYHELHHEPQKEDVHNYCIDWMKRQL